jgi:hypothetical protein
MSQNPVAHVRGLQPQLPLPEIEPSVSPDTAGDDEPEWRLDEHTRRVGRQGIAAARARLRSASGRAA